MSRLSRMLETAFSQIPQKSTVVYDPWSIIFVYRTWDVYFELYYFRTRVLSGNTYDKKLTVLSQDPVLVQKVLEDFEVILPEYKVKHEGGVHNEQISEYKSRCDPGAFGKR